MTRSKSDTQIFLLDTNPFISAIKHPRKKTGTLRLILYIIQDPNLRLVGNDLLVEEMARYAELFRSETAATLLYALIAKMELIHVQQNHIKICKSYMETPDKMDILHAATCLQTNAVLISNDHHFHHIREEGIISVWTATQAISKLLKRREEK
ncbi:MAG: PIN domain-containing protein [Thermoproteota archaeon]